MGQKLHEFQNRKRYGTLRKWIGFSATSSAIMNGSFKTVNGMEPYASFRLLKYAGFEHMTVSKP